MIKKNSKNNSIQLKLLKIIVRIHTMYKYTIIQKIAIILYILVLVVNDS